MKKEKKYNKDFYSGNDEIIQAVLRGWRLEEESVKRIKASKSISEKEGWDGYPITVKINWYRPS
jgi:hypothetical protein